MSDAEIPSRCVTPERTPKANKDAFLAAFAAKGCTTDADRAAFLQMPRRSVYRYVEGKINPRLTTARHIAARLDRNVDELWPAA